MLDTIIRQLLSFEREAHLILGRHETSPSRIVVLDGSYKTLSNLNIAQDELFRQALRCVENALFRPAHVMAWAGFMDFLETKVSKEGLQKLQQVRPRWNVNSLEDLRERVPEYQLIESFQGIGLCTKNDVKALHGLLNKRNECAHPSSYFPELNETLGYISELFQRIRVLGAKAII
ncbi:MAG: hypothetical protein O7E55_03955 [Chloroflexi bacterium]|nr:hypothetical protein [Chloroflexota bacterium]